MIANASPAPSAPRVSLPTRAPLFTDMSEVVVQRDWNGWHTASARLGDLEQVHWRQPAGAARPLIHAFVTCSNLLRGDVSHDCTATTPPHRLLICVLKSHTAPMVFEELVRRAAQSPTLAPPEHALRR